MVMNETGDVHQGSPAPDSRSPCSVPSSGGREDVYPRRFESLRTGKSGYAPACANEWRPGGVREAEDQVRRLSPPAVPSGHRRRGPLAPDRCGRCGCAPFTMGVYPMRLDETCHLLAVDFDGRTWGEGRPPHIWRPAPGGVCPRRSNGRGRATAVTSGCSSTPRGVGRSRATAGARCSSPRRWTAGPTSGSAPMTASFPARTRCRTADSAI